MKKKTYTIIKLLDMINKGRVSDIELKKIAMKSGMSRSDLYSSLEILDSLEYIKRKSDGTKYFSSITQVGKKTLKQFGYMLEEKFRKMA